MENISLKYSFELENGNIYNVNVKDVKSDITEAEIRTLANTFIDKGSEYKGSKFKAFVKCNKIITNTETITP